MTDALPIVIEYLYAIEPGAYDANDNWRTAHVIQLRITKKTVKRIYYVRPERDLHPRTAFVNRQAIERDGEVVNRSRSWWEADIRVYLTPPTINELPARPDPSTLRAAMANAHPDRGGSDAAFIAARARYQAAREEPTG